MQYTSPKKVTDKDITSIYRYDTGLQDIVNIQVKIELFAFYSYLKMSQFFKRHDQDRAGFAKYFGDAAKEELEHADEFMKYQHMRGGKVDLSGIPAPSDNNWKNGLDVLKAALELEKDVTDQVLCLHSFAVHKYEDTDFVNFLEEKIIPEQYQSMKEIQTHIKTLERACPNSLNSDGVCSEYPIYELRFDEILRKGKN